jgi:predicted phage terminase large subunit-like protein
MTWPEANDPLGRAAGEAIWPAWEDRDALLAKRLTLGDRNFATLFQRSPPPDAGYMFQTGCIKFLDQAPAGVAVRAWDLAATEDVTRDPDWTVGVRLCRDANGKYVVEDVRRVRRGPADVAALIEAVARADGTAVAIGLPRDPGQAGHFQVAALTSLLAGYRVVSSPETGSKSERASWVASQVTADNVSVVRAAWNRAFLAELELFPFGEKDDQVDALARAFGMLVANMRPGRFMDLSVLGR